MLIFMPATAIYMKYPCLCRGSAVLRMAHRSNAIIFVRRRIRRRHGELFIGAKSSESFAADIHYRRWRISSLWREAYEALFIQGS